LPVIVAEAARDARHMAGVLHRAQCAVKLDLEAWIHATNDVILQGHSGSLCRNRILPSEVPDHVFGFRFDNSLRNAHGFVLLPNRNLSFNLNPLDHPVRVDFWSALIQRP
jgi:hypothetical protein